MGKRGEGEMVGNRVMVIGEEDMLFLRLSDGQILRRKGGVFVVCVVVAVFWGESF